MYNLAAMEKKPLKAYRFFPIASVKLIRNFDNYPPVTHDLDFTQKEKGWKATGWGWLIQPTTFNLEHKTACLFTRREPHTQFPHLVKAWIYTETLREIFKTEARDTFLCWVDPTCLYELKLT